jgi:phage regulator Rha-like protein
MIFPLFSSIFANTCGKPSSRTIKKNSRLDRLNGFSSRYEYEQNAKIVCFFVTQNSFLLIVVFENGGSFVLYSTESST